MQMEKKAPNLTASASGVNSRTVVLGCAPVPFLQPSVGQQLPSLYTQAPGAWGQARESGPQWRDVVEGVGIMGREGITWMNPGCEAGVRKLRGKDGDRSREGVLWAVLCWVSWGETWGHAEPLSDCPADVPLAQSQGLLQLIAGIQNLKAVVPRQWKC